MAKHSGTRSLTAFAAIVTVGTALSFGVSAARAADEVTEDQILKALTPAKKAPLTRGLSAGGPAEPAANPAETKFVSTVRGRTTRSLSQSEREEIAAIVKDKPKIDLEITFDYNSADISAKSIPSVQALGSTFVVAGHTDAAGGEEYNQSLSERRADAIKKYLVDKYGINGSDLVTVGYGKSKLKDASQPLAEANRRVQVVNMENKTTAQK
jgi:outer membrane protein OmpA-like peptidoglycan-associated protein